MADPVVYEYARNDVSGAPETYSPIQSNVVGDGMLDHVAVNRLPAEMDVGLALMATPEEVTVNELLTAIRVYVPWENSRNS